MARDAQIQMRRDTAANWTSVNPTLAAGEFGLDTTNNWIKIGDGSTAWTGLGYLQARKASEMQPSSGLDIYPRWALAQTRSWSGANGYLFVGLFVATSPLTVSNITMTCTVAGTDTGGTTVRRMGLFTYNESTPSVTCVARTANDSTLFTSVANYTKALDTTGGFPSTYALTPGTTYGVGALCYNTGGTFNAPTILAIGTGQSSGGLLPRLQVSASGQTDMTSSTVTVSGTGVNSGPWARLT
jgi:hypothetical protein